jgi:hypothetical protein
MGEDCVPLAPEEPEGETKIPLCVPPSEPSLGAGSFVVGGLVVGGSGAVTVMLAVPLFPSLAAVTVAVPAATAVTTPAEETVATDWSLEIQVMLRPVSVAPDASFSVAESVFVSPATRLAELGETLTLATAGSSTVTDAESRSPSLVA